MNLLPFWREQLKRLPFVRSLRQQYLILAVALATVTVTYTWITGAWVSNSGQQSTYNIEQRIKVADLTHRIRRSIVEANNALNIYLLSPNETSRSNFHAQITQSNRYLEQLLEVQWVTQSQMFDVLHSFKPVLANLASSGEEVMKVRQNADLMYPAMRVANGEMLQDNTHFLTEAGNAIVVLERKQEKFLSKPERQLLKLMYQTRDIWLRMISAYRLYLINRIGSLHESALISQAGDVDLLIASVNEKVKSMTYLIHKYDVDLEVAHAVEQMSTSSHQWYNGYKEVVRINTEGHWRGDVPLMKDIIHPLLSEVNHKLDQLEDEVKQSADLDLVEQTQIGDTIMRSLWGMALFVLCIAVLSLLVLEFNFIRPIASVARSLKDEAQGKSVEQLPDVHTSEIRDLTDAFAELRQQVHSRQMALEHIALHDALTSLPNRTLLMDRLHQAIENARKRQRMLALIMLDLDRFKEINDTLGHQTGDALLQQVGSRLRAVLRDSDTVARLGGDEFAIMLTNINETNATHIATSIHTALEKVYEVYDHSLYVGVSLGVAIFPQHGETADTLLQHADVAMYMAKRTNTGISVYDTTRDQHSVTQLSVLSDMREAVENNEFFLLYQPKLSMKDSKVVGVEALIRWQHPVHGIIVPDDFISTAEQTGLIKRISTWVLEQAIRDCRSMHDKGFNLFMSVNLSVWDVQESSLAQTVRELLAKYRFPPEKLMLEITERVMMAEPERAHQVLKELDKMGVQIVIDDFGTGFSSLVYLKHLPVDNLKIDKSFVMDMLKDESNAAIVHSIIELAHNLGLQVVAEGVENDQTWSWLKKWQCDYAQGFYISHPLTLTELQDYIQAYERHGLLG